MDDPADCAYSLFEVINMKPNSDNCPKDEPSDGFPKQAIGLNEYKPRPDGPGDYGDLGDRS